MTTLHIHPVPAFRDNYIWIIHNATHAAIVDPGDATPVLDYLQSQFLQPVALLITHHHSDHTGGNAQLLERFDIPVYGPAQENIATVSHTVRENDQVALTDLELSLRVIEIPGHTHGHIAYYGLTQQRGVLFCGDTLFACGCGRIFEGTPQQMHDSLHKLADLPDDTRVYCTHEYTLSNIRFARTVEPGNNNLQQFERHAQDQRGQNLPTLPTDIATEKACNPFLRCEQAEVIRSANRYSGRILSGALDVFTALREWKNGF